MRSIVAAAAVLAGGGALADVKGDRGLGEHLSGECVACHQLSGKAVGAIPPIIGVQAESFVALMNAYRGKERENRVMQVIAARLSDDDIAALAVFFESVRPKP